MRVENLDKKRVCDISEDRTTITIRRGDCVTVIHIKNSPSLEISNLRVKRPTITK